MNEALAGFDVVASASSETGTLYVVPKNTIAKLVTIQNAAVGSAFSEGSGVDTKISINSNPAMAPGTQFVVYAVDSNGVISRPSETAFTVDYSGTDTIDIGGSVEANVSELGGKHVFKVDLTGERQYAFFTDNSEVEGGIQDPTLRLFFHDGLQFNELTYDDDSGVEFGSLEAKISLPSEESQTATYYIMVEAYSDSSTGTTTLTLINN